MRGREGRGERVRPGSTARPPDAHGHRLLQRAALAVEAVAARPLRTASPRRPGAVADRGRAGRGRRSTTAPSLWPRAPVAPSVLMIVVFIVLCMSSNGLPCGYIVEDVEQYVGGNKAIVRKLEHDDAWYERRANLGD